MRGILLVSAATALAAVSVLLTSAECGRTAPIVGEALAPCRENPTLPYGGCADLGDASGAVTDESVP